MNGNLLGIIPPDQWDAIADLVLADIRAAKGDHNWVPKFLNGRREFEKSNAGQI